MPIGRVELMDDWPTDDDIARLRRPSKERVAQLRRDYLDSRLNRGMPIEEFRDLFAELAHVQHELRGLRRAKREK
jgi:hypothetical protein